MRKRYILFAYSDYYPCGGSNDERERSDDIQALREAASKIFSDTAEILDMDTGEWITVRDCGQLYDNSNER